MSINERGSVDSIEPDLVLHAGSLRMIFEPQTVFLRYIKWQNREVLGGIYAAVRDEHWGTIAPHVCHLQKSVKEDSFQLQFDVIHRQNAIDFCWHGTLQGSEDGTVIYHFEGVAKSTFTTNRIGLCVLHPMRCAGQTCEILHTNGRIEKSAFPQYIAPHQPFVDVRTITHEVAPGVRATVRCEGDTFETEDQRNWTDASFKTYNRPLSLPFPFEVEKDSRIEQRIILSLDASNQAKRSCYKITFTERAEITISLDPQQSVSLPPIGLGAHNPEIALSETSLSRLREIAPQHLRVDVKLDEDYQTVWRKACENATLLQAQLEAALFVSDAAQAELDEFVKSVADVPVARWMIFHRQEKTTSRQWIAIAKKYLKKISSAPVGSGTNAYFTELNRERPALDASDFVAYSLNPQVHAFDDRSIVETLPAQAQTLQAAQQFACGKPVIVSPVTLRPRYNADATGAVQSSFSSELPSNVDTRQLSLLGAAWTLASIKHLAQAGAASLTYYETVGWRGVMETERGSPLPQFFPSRPRCVFPLYHVLADAAEYTGGKVVASYSNKPLIVESLVLQQGNKSTFLLANFTPEVQKVIIKNVAGKVRLLDKSNLQQALQEPEKWRLETRDDFKEQIVLPPYGLARIDKKSSVL